MAHTKNLLYVQSGGVTSVINASACGVLEEARKYPSQIGAAYAAAYGIRGLLQEDIYDLTKESKTNINALRYRPGGIFGSSRHRMMDPAKDESEYQRLLAIFRAHNIGYFLYNGGGGSMDAANKMANYCDAHNCPVSCIGIPKTIDNDIAHTDSCPGYGSVAKFTATAALEAGLDVASMHTSSTKVLLMEVMGRHAGWIAAAAGLAHQKPEDPPHLIIFPERPLNKTDFLKKIKECVQRIGYCVVIVAEGARGEDGEYISANVIRSGTRQLGGAAAVLAVLIKELLGYKLHCVISDYLQRSARHLSSRVDLDHAYAVGSAAVDYAIAGKTKVMPVIQRLSSSPYRWKIGEISLAQVADSERFLPQNYISSDGYGISPAAREHILPLIQGEAYPPYENGLPEITKYKFPLVKKKLPNWKKEKS